MEYGNARQRVLKEAITRAKGRLVEAGGDTIPDEITPHSLRRTFATVLAALGENEG